MASVYNPIIYNLYFKEKRKKANLITLDISKISSKSVGVINKFENTIPIQKHPRYYELSTYYNVNTEELHNFDSVLDQLLSRFSNNILYGLTDDLEESYIKIIEFLNPYKQSVLGTIENAVTFIYQTFKGNTSQDKLILDINKSIDLLSSKYQALFKLYLGQYYLSKKNLALAKSSYDEAYQFLSETGELIDMYHYCQASYYVRKGDIPNSIFHCEKAITLFTKSQNFRRLTNTNIIVGNQYLKLKNYFNAYKIFKDTLAITEQNNFLYEKRICLNNIAFIHMMENTYEKALPYITQIPLELFYEDDYYSYALCLTQTKDFEKGLEISLKGKEISTTPYHKYIFKICIQYFSSGDLRKFSRDLEKSLTKYSDYLDTFEKELLCVILLNCYKNQGNLKKSVEIYEILHSLNYTFHE